MTTISLSSQELAAQKKKLHPDWKVIEGHHIEREFLFPDFQAALDFTNAVGKIAEEHDHHPDILLSYGKVKIQSWTHTAKGITHQDIDLARLCDQLV